VLAFADPEIVRLAREDFIPVTGDDWYQRRRDDEEGKFFRKVVGQGPRKGSGTKQSVYCLTAGGKLLSSRPGDVKPEYMRETLRRGLAAWNKLPESERQPGAVKVPDLAREDPRFSSKPPEGGLILTVHARILQKDAQGILCKGTCKTIGGDQASRDHLWITAAEWKALTPADPRPGATAPFPSRIAERILRFHLVDNTRGEPPMWTRDQIRSSQLTLTVMEATAGQVRLRLDGSALLSSDADVASAGRGFDVSLLGYIDYDRRKKAVTRFDIVARGDHWGSGHYTGGAREGRSPLGIAFTLSAGKLPADQVPPQGMRDRFEYLPRER
jgi:hypothetical protein